MGNSLSVQLHVQIVAHGVIEHIGQFHGDIGCSIGHALNVQKGAAVLYAEHFRFLTGGIFRRDRLRGVDKLKPVLLQQLVHGIGMVRFREETCRNTSAGTSSRE